MRNPGPGGWAALVLSGDEYQVCSGSAADTTNNRMEQTAVIQGLQATPQSSHVTIFTDSQYVIGTMTKGWKRRVNSDLWDVLDALCSRRTVTWEWVRGHTGEPGNEFVDAQAKWEAGVRSTGPQISEYFSGIEEGMFNVDNQKAAVWAILGALNWVVQWYSPSGKMTPDGIAEDFGALFVRSLSKH